MFLNLEDDGNFSSIYVVGIVTTSADYKLSLALNRSLSISLSCAAPLYSTKEAKNSEWFFSHFRYANSSNDIIFNLIANRCGNSFLIKKMKNIDYLLVIHSSRNFFNIEDIVSRLKGIDEITALFNIDNILPTTKKYNNTDL